MRENKGLKKIFDDLESGRILPEIITEKAYPGYWDEHFDFRTGGGDISKGGMRVVQTSRYVVWVSHEATTSCPSGPCGYEERINVGIKPGHFKKMYGGKIISPFPNRSIKILVEDDKRGREVSESHRPYRKLGHIKDKELIALCASA